VKRRGHEGGQVERAEVAGAIGRQGDLAAGLVGAQRFAVMQRVVRGLMASMNSTPGSAVS